MQCLYPLKGYRQHPTPERPIQPLHFKAPDDSYLPISVPCGQCIACRLERSRQWAVRCMHEASLHHENAFVTLTYDNAHLPITGSLDKTAFPAFIKRLRKRVTGKLKYFHAGEYGDHTGRPHYHACLFGVDFPDKHHWSTRGDYRLYTSAALESLWTHGQCLIGDVTFESAAYVARYILKKVTGPHAQAHYTAVDLQTGELHQLAPEYTTMSRRPGLARGWALKYLEETYASDSIITRGHESKPPRYYDQLYELQQPEPFRALKHERALKRNYTEETPQRLAAHEAHLKARLALTTRSAI